MKVYFFEEYPTKKNLDKLDLVDFNTKLFIADYSIEGFKAITKQIKNNFVKESIYWPLLNIKEGYWFSAFSKRKAMLRSFNELNNTKIKIMLDLELPMLTKKLFFTQFFKSFKNKKYILGFIKKYYRRIYTGEYFFDSKKFGLSINEGQKVIKMMYSSMLKVNNKEKRKKLIKLKEKYGKNLLIGLGCIGVGVLGNEKQITIEELERDFKLCRDLGIQEVVIFRLGGLNKEYLKVIKKFI